MIPRCVRRAAVSDVVFANNKAKRLAIRLTRWTGTTSEYECRPEELAAELGKNDFRYPEKNAGFSPACEAT